MARSASGSVTAHKGRWLVRLTIDGQRKSLGSYDVQEEAEAALAVALEELRPSQRGGLTLRAWGARWLERRATDGLHRSATKDAARWRAYVESWECADWPMRKLARQDVVRWVRALLSERKLARQTASNALNLLRCALQDAADEGLVPGNVSRDVKVPKVPRTTEPWTYLRADELRDLFASPLQAYQRAAFQLAVYTGLRAGELWALRWEDVKATELLVGAHRATKGGKPRRVPLLPEALAALKAWRQLRGRRGTRGKVVPVSPFVFPSATAGMHGEGYDAGWSKIAPKLFGRRVRFHDLRHTCGSHLIQGTWTPRPLSLEEVQLWLGHESRTTTERYAHLAPEGIAAVAKQAREEAK